jgi:hypothetical protein
VAEAILAAFIASPGIAPDRPPFAGHAFQSKRDSSKFRMPATVAWPGVVPRIALSALRNLTSV